MTKRLARLTGVVLVLLLIAAACGDDDDATTTNESGQAAEATDEAVSDSEMSESEMADDEMPDDEMADGDMAHDHGEGLEVPEAMAIPEISIELMVDPLVGQNLAVSLENFTITPEDASTDPVDGQGHLHLYVDGERVARFYNEWMFLKLEPGEHTVEVEVSANNHAPYTVDGIPIRALATIDVPPAGDHQHHDGMTVDVDAEGAPRPTVDVVEDPKKGWNIHAQIENFTIAPEHASTEHVDGEGHLHLWVDGEKVTRLYGNWWHLAELTEGDHEITIEVSANNHMSYAVAGEPIVATTTVAVSADQATSATEMASDDEQIEMLGAADVTIDAVFAGGSVSVADDRIEVDRGAVVALTVESDVDESIHVHGYDILQHVEAGEVATLVFVADVPGVFEVELEDSVTFVTELIVE